MKCQLLIALTAAAFASSARAEPQIIHFPGDKDSDVFLPDYAPAQLPVRLRYNKQGFGGGKATDYFAPIIVEDEVACFSTPPTEIDVEAADLSTGQNNAFPIEPGTYLENAIGGWVYTEPLCDVGTALPNVLSAYYGAASDPCATCRIAEPTQLLTDHVYYIPIRVKPMSTDDWTYGWAAFRLTSLVTPECYDSCEPGHPLTQHYLDYIAVGLETEPNTPIIAGGGLCPGDINFDAQRDTFDVFDYLDLFNTMDPAADYTNDGSIDVFDVFAFLNDFQSPCEF